ncbi:putative exonuclease of the beta-lactamase fold involved in RNA processing [Belliella baltica DSM 15883]|uniref:Putative exonuclease of the beta-lactamase fold involved in RNA processing n=1 Tax=Belliella baltica (strain DSM 15883 / CIP 108006 / LMG 21964 / BA134) TaxID=866536 RepID=I3ZA68_BELBD|nr:MBL fold metallo-hydrolase [Belliella baltica]AFL86136.1 putative exonuclease of the beta-lactamase fold involved in RNA processing [Belliella baltica DSM 15883]
MKVKVKFLGGAGTVTGSRYLLEINNYKVLVDCGMFQGLKDYRVRNWEAFPISPSEIDMVILTHAHIDHSGYLPKLVKEGFRGPIYGTEATLELIKILLLDSAKLQEEAAAYAQKKGYSKHEKPLPLYTIEDAERVFPLLKGADFEEEQSEYPEFNFTFYNAGHILGAAIVKLKVNGAQQVKKIVFSGDLGRYHDPILNPPARLPFADILFLESTYGDRVSKIKNPEEELGRAIREAYRRGGVALIPAFAVGRTQMMLYYLHRLQQKGKIPDIPIYVDSPMAIDVTKLYKSFNEYHRLKPLFEEEGSNPFSHKNLHYYQSQEASISLNAVRGDAIIISASGMATGGRVMHHLYNRLPKEQDTVIFVGYQAVGTRGRKLLEGDQSVKMYGLDVPIKAKIEYIEGLSAHADQEELIDWSEGFTSKPKITFLVHGEDEARIALQQKLKEELDWDAIIPEYLESFELFDGI